MIGSGEAQDHGPAAVSLTVLGSLRLEREGRPLPLPTHKAQSLLAYLALHPGPTGREKLAALFWGDSTDEDARRSLRVALSALRKTLGDLAVLADRDTVQIDPAFSLHVDALEFESQARAFFWAASPDPSAIDLSLYRGDLLADFYDDWIPPERERLRDLYARTLHALVARLRTLGDYRGAIDTARRLLTIDPADEEAHQHIIACYLALGDRSAAAEQYDACETALRQELGVKPSPATIALAGALKAAPAAPAPAARRTNLPTPPTSFIGREEEVEEIISLLHESHVRLLTLTGAGGSGKTRLAIEAAAELMEPYPDGVWWVELAALEEQELVPQAVSRALGLLEVSDRPTEELLVDFLGGKKLLLVEDSCEHLLAGCARLAERLLTYCLDVQILATSREPLGAPGEQIWPVPTLACPDPALLSGRNGAAEPPERGLWEQKNGGAIPEVVTQSAAVTLFVERATAQRPGFRLTPDNARDIVQICCRLDGIPLALELAAARVKVLTPNQMATRLDKRLDLLTGGVRTGLPRHQTLRATIDWSYGLLEPAEQLLFRRLAAFIGGFTLEAAEAICADDPSPNLPISQSPISAAPLLSADVLNLLARLVDKSLVRAREVGGEMRYEMLETIHAYARERLRETAELTTIHSRHLAYYTDFVERTEPYLIGPQQATWLAVVEQEYDNVRAALRRALVSPDESWRLLGIRMAGALEYFWSRRNYAREGGMWIEQALAMMTPEMPPAIQARFYRSAGTIIWLHGEPARAGELHARSLAAYRAVGDLAGTSLALGFLANQLHMQGRIDEAIALTEEAVSLARQTDFAWSLSSALGNLGWHYLDLHDLVRAEPLCRESVEVARIAGDDNFLVSNLNNMAVVVQELGYAEEATAFVAEAVRAAQRLGDVRVLSLSWQAEGRVYQQQERWAQAIPAYRESLVMLARTADKANVIETMEGLAVALVEDGQAALGITLLAATITQREALHFLSSPPPYQASQQQAILARLAAEMGQAAFAAAWSRGRAMSLDEAIQMAL